MKIASLEQLTNTPSWSSRKTPVICTQVIDETPDVKTFQFQAIDHQQFHFKPGQFVGIQVEINGETHNRSYTIASTPSRPHLLELTIKKEQGGTVSPWLHENIVKGSQIELRGPAGRFNCFDTSHDKVLLISAGSGITPMMSMARFFTDTDSDKDIQFLNWVKSVDDIIFRRELALMQHKNPQFSLEVFCTRPGLNQNWLGKRGRINTNVLKEQVPDLNERTVFCCGPEPFMDMVKSCLGQLDFNMQNYHDESFDPGGKKKASQQKASTANNSLTPNQQNAARLSTIYQAKLKKSDITIDLTPDDILLEQIEKANVEIASACRGGNCGACHVKKFSGDTTTEVEVGLTDELRRQGYILTCTTRLRSNIELDI